MSGQIGGRGRNRAGRRGRGLGLGSRDGNHSNDPKYFSRGLQNQTGPRSETEYCINKSKEKEVE